MSGIGPWPGNEGFIEGTGEIPAFPSLYEAQLNDRMAHGVAPDAPFPLRAVPDFDENRYLLEWSYVGAALEGSSEGFGGTDIEFVI